jgi:hypothetical protein
LNSVFFNESLNFLFEIFGQRTFGARAEFYGSNESLCEVVKTRGNSFVEWFHESDHLVNFGGILWSCEFPFGTKVGVCVSGSAGVCVWGWIGVGGLDGGESGGMTVVAVVTVVTVGWQW